VVVTVFVTGLIITILMKLGDKFTTKIKASDEYQAHAAALEQKEKETLKTKREAHPEPTPSHNRPYTLDPLSFSLLILFFVAVFAILSYSLIAPTGEYMLFGATFYTGMPILVLFLVVTIPLLAWRVRRNRLDAVAETDYSPIPWDFIAVLVTGLLVVGVGVGLMLYL
jgi:hypothetical protein